MEFGLFCLVWLPFPDASWMKEDEEEEEEERGYGRIRDERPTDRRTNGPTDGRRYPLIEIGGRI